VKYTFQIVTQTCIVAAIIAGCALYLRHVRIGRPPIGRFNAQDVTTITILVVVTPLGYVNLPVAALTTLFALVFCAAIQTALDPLIGGKAATAATALTAAADIALAVAHQHVALTVLNDVIVGVALLGVTNLWAQSGATVKHVAIIAAVLAVFDPLATWITPLMGDLFIKLTGQPFAPMLSLTGQIRMRLGLGDCLMFALWPLVLAKGYGRLAAWIGAVLGIMSLFGMAVVFFGMEWIHNNLIAVMSILGPVILLQYAVMRISRGPERRVRDWRRGRSGLDGPAALGQEAPAAAFVEADGLASAVRSAWGESDLEREGPLFGAFHEGALVATGDTAARARRAARQAGCSQVPIVIGLSA